MYIKYGKLINNICIYTYIYLNKKIKTQNYTNKSFDSRLAVSFGFLEDCLLTASIVWYTKTQYRQQYATNNKLNTLGKNVNTRGIWAFQWVN